MAGWTQQFLLLSNSKNKLILESAAVLLYVELSSKKKTLNLNWTLWIHISQWQKFPDAYFLFVCLKLFPYGNCYIFIDRQTTTRKSKECFFCLACYTGTPLSFLQKKERKKENLYLLVKTLYLSAQLYTRTHLLFEKRHLLVSHRTN